MASMRTDDNEWMSLPGNLKQIGRLFHQNKLHPAMKMASYAIQMKRSPNQVSLLLVGLSGAGKSLTVNNMFETNVAKTSDVKSETRCTIEYTVNLKSTKFRILDLQLSIIDTPGFNDTDGLEQDAKNIMSISYFLKSHPKMRNSYPNLVMIALNIQDNRIEGENSNFAKMLKCLSTINVIDRYNPNVVVVLTHAASIARKPELWTKYVETKTEHVHAIVYLLLGVKPEIVVQENLPEEYELERDGDWYLLPNGDKQPKILYQACERILNTANDLVGHEALALFFRPNMDKSVRKGHVINSSEVTNADTQDMLDNMLSSVSLGSTSEVGSLLETHKKKINDRVIGHHILVLQGKFRQLGISRTVDLQRMSMNSLIAKMNPAKISKEMEKVLGEVFGLFFEQDSGFHCHVGKGYNIFKDTASQFSPLVMEEDDKCRFPANVHLQESASFEFKCQSIKDNNDYVSKRLRDLQIDNNGDINFNAFNLKPRHGYNKSNESRNFATETETSFSVEHRIKKLVVRPPFKITKEFKTDVNALPSDYDLKNETSVMKWKAFFEKWGMYVITGAFLGGSLTGHVKVVSEQTSTANNMFKDAQAALAMQISFLQGETDFDFSQGKANINSTILNWRGGNKETQKTSLEIIEQKDWKAWVESLEYSPVPLWSDLDLYPLYHLAYDVSPEKGTKMQMAMNLALKGQLTFESTKVDNRANTATSRDSDGCFHENSVVMLQNGMFKQMKDLTIGDKIFVMDSRGALVQDKIFTWLHQVRDCKFTFLQIVHELGKITLTPNHIIFVGKHRKSQHASSLKPGNKISFLKNENGRQVVTLALIITINKVEGRGIYAPLTISGRLLVDRIDVSCYCTLNPVQIFGSEVISSQELAHAGFLPLRIAYKFGLNINTSHLDDGSGIHSYARWLMKVVLGK